jgi:hypothetical protein
MPDRVTPNLPKSRREAVVEEYNRLVDALRASGAVLHDKADGSAAVITTDDATDVTTGAELANELKTAWGVHIADTDMHLAADSTNTISAADATDQATLETLVNEMKADFNGHHSDYSYHYGNAEGGQVAPVDIATSDGTDLTTDLVLVNAIKAAFNAHAGNAAQRLDESGSN